MQALASTDSLLGRCVAGDRSAWRELHRSLHPAVVAFLRQMGVGPEDIDDVCQDVFLQVARYLPRFEQRAELKTWVYKICASQAARLRRKRTLAARSRACCGWCAGRQPGGARSLRP